MGNVLLYDVGNASESIFFVGGVAVYIYIRDKGDIFMYDRTEFAGFYIPVKIPVGTGFAIVGVNPNNKILSRYGAEDEAMVISRSSTIVVYKLIAGDYIIKRVPISGSIKPMPNIPIFAGIESPLVDGNDLPPVIVE